MVQSWLNPDGLYRKFGPDNATANIGGEYKTYGDVHEMEFDVTLTTIGSSPTILSDQVFFPTNARIESIEVIAHTAATSAGGTATMNLGLQSTDRTTQIDYDGFLATYDQSRMDVAGEKNTVIVGGTDAGALIGTTNTTIGYVTADWDTEAFTGGRVRIRVRYYMV
jgi:hypothetical protein